MKLRTEHHFDSAHRLSNYNGACFSLHGHRWRVIVEVTGNPDLKTDMVVDFKILKGIIDELDHKTLLKDCASNRILIAALAEMNNRYILFDSEPTAEFLAIHLTEKFMSVFPKLQFVVTIFESPNYNASYGVIK